MDTPEYKMLTSCFPRLASCIQQSPNDIVLQLRPSGILATGDLAYLGNPHHNNDQKAQKIVEIVLHQVKINSRVFPAFVFALEAAGSWTGTVVSELKDLYRVPSRCLESSCPNRVDKSTSTTLSLEHRGNSSQDQATQTADSSAVRSLYQIVEAKMDIESGTTEGELDRETKRIRRKFAGLINKVIASIKLAKVKVKSLATFFQQIDGVNAVLVSAQRSRLFFTPEVICEFETGDFDNVFRILKDYYSWFNFDLIEDIIEEFGSNDVALKRELCDYKDRMKQYCDKRLLKDSDSPNAFGEHRDNAKPCIFKIDEEWETMRFSELKTIKTIICDVLGLKGVALFLRTVSNGCVELTFDIPEHVANVVFPLSKDQVGALKAHGIQYHDSSKSLPLDPEPLIEGGVSDEQLDTTIRMRDTDELGQSFDSMSALLTKLSLTSAEATMVNRTADKKGTQAGIAHALRLWRNANPSKATYRTLLEIAESLRRDTTSQICGVLAKELPMEERFPPYFEALAHGSLPIERQKGYSAIEELKRECGVSDEQLNPKIREEHLHNLAGCFDQLETYLTAYRVAAMLNTPLNVSDHLRPLTNVLREVRHRWYLLGLQLNIDHHTLEEIKFDCRDSVRDCLRSVLVHFLKRVQPSPTLSDLVTALQSPPFNQPQLVMRIRELANKESTRDFNEHTGNPSQHNTSDSAVILVESTHLQMVKMLVWEARVQWRALARALGVPHHTVEEIRHDLQCRNDGDRLEVVLTEWMRGGTATIHDLLTALNNHNVNCGHVSSQLRALQGEARLKLGLCKTDCSLCLS